MDASAVKAIETVNGVLSKLIAREDDIFRAAKDDEALSDTGRDAIVDRALARGAVLRSALCAIQIALRNEE